MGWGSFMLFSFGKIVKTFVEVSKAGVRGREQGFKGRVTRGVDKFRFAAS